MKCSEIIRLLGELAPESCACDWDNPGLLAGRSDKEVKKIYIALDAEDSVVEEAIRREADLLLTHHPLIFQPIRKVNDQNFITRRLVKLIQADISYYAMHTNFDSAPGCMADLAAERLSMLRCEPLETMGELEQENGSVAYGIGKIGELEQAVSVKKLAETVKDKFELPFVQVYGPGLMEREVTRIAVCPGAGGSVIQDAIDKGAQVLVTGDISHHQGIDAAARGMAVIDAGHYGLEHIFIHFMAEYLKKRLEGRAEVLEAPTAWPSVLL